MISLMKATLLALFVTLAAGKKTPQPFGVLNVPRGGGAIGPLDEAMMIDLGKVATTAYVAGSGAKILAAQAGTSAPKVTDILTHELMALNAIACAIATGMYGLAGNAFDPYAVALVVGTLQAIHLIQGGGGVEKIVDTVMDNKLFFLAMYLPSVFIYFS